MHNVAYELFEVRNGHGLRPILRLGGATPEGTVDAVRREAREVMTKVRGEDGEQKRKNVRQLRDELARGWEAEGRSWVEVKRILDSVL